MSLSAADEERLIASIKLKSIPKIPGAAYAWTHCAEADVATFVNAHAGASIEIPRSSFEEFGVENVKTAIEVCLWNRCLKKINSRR